MFWQELDAGAPEFAMAAALVVFVAWWNARGSAAPTYARGALVVLGDLALQLLIVAFGLAHLFEPEVLTDPASVAGTPSLEDLLFVFPLVLVAFSGLDASSGLAGQVAIGRRGLRRLIGCGCWPRSCPYVGIALVASAALPRDDRPAGTLGRGADARRRGRFAQAWLREPLRYLVAVSAIAILVAACSAAMLGVSRLGYSLAVNRQIPSRVGYLHPQRSTPVVIIGIGALLAILLLLPADLEFLLGISAFGATVAFTLVCLSVSGCAGASPSATGRTGCRSTCACAAASCRCPPRSARCSRRRVRRACSPYHGGARWVGLGWMAFGVALYVYYRLCEDKPLFKRVTVPERVLTRRRAPRPSTARSSCRSSGCRSTTTSCRPRAGWPPRRTRTSARAAR